MVGCLFRVEIQVININVVTNGQVDQVDAG